MAVSEQASLPAPGAPGLWPHNESLFEFTFKHQRVPGKTAPQGPLSLTLLGFSLQPCAKGLPRSHPHTNTHVVTLSIHWLFL